MQICLRCYDYDIFRYPRYVLAQSDGIRWLSAGSSTRFVERRETPGQRHAKANAKRWWQPTGSKEDESSTSTIFASRWCAAAQILRSGQGGLLLDVDMDELNLAKKWKFWILLSWLEPMLIKKDKDFDNIKYSKLASTGLVFDSFLHAYCYPLPNFTC